jgi:hypothetical protein
MVRDRTNSDGRVLEADGGSMSGLDRLAALGQIISKQTVCAVLKQTGRENPRACRLSHEVCTWVLLAMGVFTDLPIRSVYQHARRLMPGDTIPTRGALCLARQRLGVAPLRVLFEQLVRPLVDDQIPGATLGGLRLIGIDGTRLDVPDTPANEAAFGRPHGGRSDGAFPQVHKVSLVELGSRAELAFVVKPCRRNESVMAWALRPYVGAGMLVLADREFFSFLLWNAYVTQGCHLLWRGKANQVLEPIEILSDGSYLATIYPRPRDRDHDRRGVVIRVIKYTLDDPDRAGHQQVHILLTSLLDAEAFPAADLILCYHQRWEHEMMIDEQKTHHDPVRPGKPAQLRSGTPAGVLQELYAMSLGHYVTQALRVQAARQDEIDPDRISFTGTLRVLRCRLPECVDPSPETFQRWLSALLWEINQQRTEPRRCRINPRVVKHQVSNYAKKHPHHRGMPSQRKPFLDIVVMTI